MSSAAKKPAHAPSRAALLALLDEAFDKRAWHGPNLRAAVRRLSVEEAAWRAGAHCIAEIAVHCAYWKYAVRRRLTGEKRGSFPWKGSNWFPLPQPFDGAAWRTCLDLLVEQHVALRAAVESLSAARMAAPVAAGKPRAWRLIHGAALHDVYHAGQIQVIKGTHRAH